eukprot:TRINITY_DN68664_c0_g1_i1.p1 TRINITY_DN68664_c0_g1~~TRINITY_DN68664_c0_g1_i1.p1  ORF type:complete len:710 (-),score=233.03 TRINITY_DN68664_c0_g1_i1:112-2241(-)
MKYQLTCGLALLATPALGSEDHPVKGVIDLLKDLHVKVEKEGREEQVTYNKFEQWCRKSHKTLTDSIEDERVTASRSRTAVSGKEAENKELTSLIERLDKEIAQHDQRVKDIEEQRTESKKLYDESSADFDSTIAALDSAVKALEESAKDAQKTSDLGILGLLQKPLVLADLTEEQEAMLRQLVTDAGAQPTKNYRFKSDKVVELLKQMTQDFKSKKKTADKAEADAVMSHKFVIEDLKKASKAAVESKIEKSTIQGELAILIQDLKGSLQTALENKAADSKSLDELKLSCSHKASEWKARKEARSGEEKAMIAAIEVLSKASGVRTQVPKSSAQLLQSSSTLDPKQDARTMVVQLLRKQASNAVHGSADLERLAAQIEASNDEKTGKDLVMSVNKQIWKLNQEQAMEDKKKQWCDKETEATHKDIEDKTAHVEKLNVTLLTKQGKVSEMQDDIDTAKARISELKESMDLAKEIRREDKAENEAAIEDAKNAQDSVKKAIEVLSEFYSGASLLQKKTKGKGIDLPDAPETWNTQYSGVADPQNQPGGVVAVLETVLEDFSKMQANTEAQEVEDQTVYEKQTQEEKVERSRLLTESELKSEERTRHELALQSAKRTMMITDRELAAAKRYLETTEVSCEGFDDEEFEKRKKARAEEIEQLNNVIGLIKKSFGLSLFQSFTPPVATAKAFLAPIKSFFAHAFLAPIRPAKK